MKKHLLLVAMLIVLAIQTKAQYCGNSGAGQCTPSGTLTTPGFTPSSDVPCLVRGQSVNTIIELNPDSMRFGGNYLVLQSFRVDSIGNLPTGLCWSTNISNNTISGSGTECIRISGVTYAQPGQYKLRIIVTMYVGSNPPGAPVTTNMDATGDYTGKIFLRLTDASSICPLVDTNSTNPTVIVYNGDLLNGAEVSGKLFFDVNQNQVQDNGEQPVRNQLLSLGNDYMAFTNSLGNYTAYPTAGTVTINPQLSGSAVGFAFSPDSIVVHADSVGQSYPNNNFAVIPPANYCEGSVAIIANNPPPRPGFNNDVTLRFSNLYSASAVSQSVRFYYSLNQVFVTSTPSPILVDTVNRYIDYSISNVNAGTNWQTVATFFTPQTLPINTVLNLSASVSNSSCSPLDTLKTRQDVVVVGSYDPNDKAVSPAGEGVNGHVLPSTSQFTYTIRFQNTGTYMAQDVRVTDTISNFLNLSTLQVLSASANYEVVVSGRQVMFKFMNINLPDSNANEPGSHGYIQYSIKPNNTFVQNTVVENRADIYFDFNAPIRTNTTRSTADNAVGIAALHGAALQFSVYPNPIADGNWMVTGGTNLIGKQMDVFDIAGRLVYTATVTAAQTEIDASKFQQGVYILRIQNSAVRMIKM